MSDLNKIDEDIAFLKELLLRKPNKPPKKKGKDNKPKKPKKSN